MRAVPKRIAKLVDERDDQSCLNCGNSLEVVEGSRHHRQRRRVGGHTPQNIVLLCGSGTTGCHGFMHANPAQARAAGYIVSALAAIDPVDVPVFTWPNGWVRLNDDGSFEVMDERDAKDAMDYLFGEAI